MAQMEEKLAAALSNISYLCDNSGGETLTLIKEIADHHNSEYEQSKVGAIVDWPDCLPAYPLIEDGDRYGYLLSNKQTEELRMLAFDHVSIQWLNPRTGDEEVIKIVSYEFIKSNGEYNKVEIIVERR